MSAHEGHHRVGRPSIALAGLLSCSVICAAVIGAVTAPFVGVVLVMAAAIGAISIFEHEPRAEPFSVVSRIATSVPVIDARRAWEAALLEDAGTKSHSDVA